MPVTFSGQAIELPCIVASAGPQRPVIYRKLDGFAGLVFDFFLDKTNEAVNAFGVVPDLNRFAVALQYRFRVSLWEL